MNCETCCAYAKEDHTCRRHAPRQDLRAAKDEYVYKNWKVFPRVTINDWCLEWIEKKVE